MKEFFNQHPPQQQQNPFFSPDEEKERARQAAMQSDALDMPPRKTALILEYPALSNTP